MLKNNIFNWWVGVVEDRNDPEKLGRVRVRILGAHSDDRAVLPTEDLPWALPLQPTTSAAVSGIGSAPVGLLTGTWCVGFYMDGDDMQQPIVMGTLGGTPRPLPSCVASNRESTFNPPNVVRASDGSPVLDSSGNPIIRESESTSGEQISATLPPLTQAQIQSLMNAIGFKESSSVVGGAQYYNTINRLGYIGKYQFGAQALATLGYVKLPASSKINNSVLDSDSSWTGKSGITSKAMFLNAGSVQETVMFENLQFNYNVLKRKGTITTNDTPGRVAGLLCVSHLLGSGGAIAFANGSDSKDGNGTSGRTYYQIGAAAVGESIPLENPPTSLIPANKDPAGTLNDRATIEPRAFSDPNSEFPRCDYANIPDTNKLATGSIENTPIERRRNTQRTDVPIVTGDPWDEPFPAFCAKYPYNQTFQTEGGHLVEFDSTPGHERIHVYHKAGSFIEIDVNGSSVRKVVGDNYEIVERNNYLYTRGAYKMTVEGATQILVKNNVDLQVYGETNATFNNNLNMNVAGDLNVIAGGAFNVKAEKVSLKTSGVFEGSIGAGMNFEAGGDFTVLATGTSIDGGIVSMNGGGASSVSGNSLGDAPDSLSVENTDTAPLQRPECNAEAFELDAGEPGAADIHAAQVEKGDVVPTTPVESGEATPEENNIPVTDCDCNEFQGVTVFPDILKLSKYYTLGDLSSKAVVVKERVIAQRGLNKGQIICNLKNLAVNCLDKIKEKYPDVIVTNAFRLDKAGRSNVSDHGIGMAADIQFPSARPSDYFDIANWIAANIPYKQLLLEYGGGARNPWIHIAFDKTGQKNSALPLGTFKDHAVYARNKFVNLA